MSVFYCLSVNRFESIGKLTLWNQLDPPDMMSNVCIVLLKMMRELDNIVNRLTSSPKERINTVGVKKLTSCQKNNIVSKPLV